MSGNRQAAAPTKPRVRAVLTVAVATALLGGISGCHSKAESTEAATTTPTTTTTEVPLPPPVNRVGETVSDGGFDFVVTGFDVTPEAPNPDEAPTDGVPKPGGQLVAVKVAVTNVSDGPKPFPADAQGLMDSHGGKFSMHLRGEAPAPDDTVEPGQRIDVELAAVLPADLSPVEVNLHGDLLTPGVTVSLTAPAATPSEGAPAPGAEPTSQEAPAP